MSKRSGQFGGGKKKKQKTYHCAKENEKSGATKSKSTFNIQPDMAGVLVMCTRSKENRAVKEALDILQRYGDELYPVAEEEEEDNIDEEEDLEASIAKEVAALKKPKGRKRFANITTGTDCVVFIRTLPPIEPVKLVHHMLTDLNTTQKKTTRYISRYLPVEKTCQAHIEDIENSAKQIFAPHFYQKDSEGQIIPRRFAVVCRVRNCTKLARMDVIKALAATAGQGHKVDLNEPELTVIAEICQNICMLSVVEDFNKLKKYNIESILGVNNAGTPEEPKKESNEADVEAKIEPEEVPEKAEIEAKEEEAEVDEAKTGNVEMSEKAKIDQ
ncbi:thump domain-containing protein [Pilaira anomala]|nr:thump domain-containing protein [Pilaira anomala]